MTDIRKLMEEATPLPWGRTDYTKDIAINVVFPELDRADKVADFYKYKDCVLAVSVVNALPALLELIHHIDRYHLGGAREDYANMMQSRDALARALGVEE